MTCRARLRDTRWLALVVLCAGMLMIILDQTIVNVALPSIKHDLGFTRTTLAWVVNGYLIAFGGLLLLAGRLGDLVGRRKVFLTGLTLFTGASVICGLADSQLLLIAARFVQGLGGATASAVILGMIVTMFPEPREQARAIGVYSFVASAGASVGLLAGGVITQAINWHWIFFVNLPIGLAIGMLAWRLLERDSGIRGGADVSGALLIVAALMLGVYAIVGARDHGWGSAHTLGLGAISLMLLVAFIAREARASRPLVPLRIFQLRTIVAANLIGALMVAAMFGMFFLGALYLQGPLGYSPLQVGLAFLPIALIIGLLSLGFSARLTTRFGASAVLAPGLALIGAGLLLLEQAGPRASYLVDIAPAMVILGIGAGLSFPSLMTLSMSGIDPREAGLASGLVNTTLQVGGALGLAVLTTLSTTRSSAMFDDGASAGSALTGGYHLALLVGAGLVAVAAITAVQAGRMDKLDRLGGEDGHDWALRAGGVRATDRGAVGSGAR